MKIIFYGTREYDHYYFDVLAADPEYGCEIRFLTANLDADTAPLAQGGDAVCAFVNADCSAPVLEKLAQLAVILRNENFEQSDPSDPMSCSVSIPYLWQMCSRLRGNFARRQNCTKKEPSFRMTLCI